MKNSSGSLFKINTNVCYRRKSGNDQLNSILNYEKSPKLNNQYKKEYFLRKIYNSLQKYFEPLNNEINLNEDQILTNLKNLNITDSDDPINEFLESFNKFISKKNSSEIYSGEIKTVDIYGYPKTNLTLKNDVIYEEKEINDQSNYGWENELNIYNTEDKQEFTFNRNKIDLNILKKKYPTESAKINNKNNSDFNLYSNTETKRESGKNIDRNLNNDNNVNDNNNNCSSLGNIHIVDSIESSNDPNDLVNFKERINEFKMKSKLEYFNESKRKANKSDANSDHFVFHNKLRSSYNVTSFKNAEDNRSFDYIKPKFSRKRSIKSSTIKYNSEQKSKSILLE
jgi:hypothetical protein